MKRTLKLLRYIPLLCFVGILAIEVTFRIIRKEQWVKHVYPKVYSPDTICGYKGIPFIKGEIKRPSIAKSFQLNNQGFYVERKTTNAESWISLGFVEGNGTTTETHFYSFTDINVATGSYSYRLKQMDFDGTSRYYELSNVVEVTSPFTYSLAQNFPNPFNPSTTISYQLKNDGLVTIKIFDQLGNEVATLVNEEKTAGAYELKFNASSLASGVYYYRITSGSFVDTKKMILMK